MIDDRPGRAPRLPAEPADSFEPDGASLTTRALAHWPRLDRGQLNRARGDPTKMARVITRRTVLPVEAIVAILVRDEAADLTRGLDSDLDDPQTDREDARLVGN